MSRLRAAWRASAAAGCLALVLSGCGGTTGEGAGRLAPETAAHAVGGSVYAVTLLPEAGGLTFVTADGTRLFAAGGRVMPVAVSGGTPPLTRADRGRALAVLADFCRDRRDAACIAFGRDNGGPIFVEGRWLFQFVREG